MHQEGPALKHNLHAWYSKPPPLKSRRVGGGGGEGGVSLLPYALALLPSGFEGKRT